MKAKVYTLKDYNLPPPNPFDLLFREEEGISKIIELTDFPDLNNSFYTLSKEQILAATTPVYRQFLGESGYADLDSCLGVKIAKHCLKYDLRVKSVVSKLKLEQYKNNLDNNFVIANNQADARGLVEAFGGRLLTARLMWGLFIPYLEQEILAGNQEAAFTVKEMKDELEWLEDYLQLYNNNSNNQKAKLKIKNAERHINLPLKIQGFYFSSADINEFGYPSRLYHSYLSTNRKPHYYCHHPLNEEVGVAKHKDLDLSLLWGPNIFSGFSFRIAKFF